MKEGWTYKKIKDVGEVIGGTTPSTSNPEFWGGNICWISPAELHGEQYVYDTVKKITPKAVAAKSLKELPEGTVILSSRAPIGKIAINKVPMYCNQGFKCVVCGPELFNEFLYWWFYGKKDYLNSLGTGATFPEISKTVVENIVIPVAPMNEQLSIVSHLDAAFAHIDALKANVEKQLAEARQLFQAELTECMRPKEGWEEKTLGEVCIKSKNIKWDNVDEGKTFTYIDLTSVDRTDLQIHNPQIINKHNAPSRAKQIIHSGDIIFATTRPTLRRVSLIDEQYDGDICSTGFCVLRPDNNVVSEWIFYALQEEHFYSYIEPLQAGANYPAVTDGDVKNYAISIPSKDTQHSIVSRLDVLSANIKKLEEVQRKTLAECDAMKQAMLREVFE